MQLRGPVGSEVVEEPGQRGRVAALAGPHDGAGVVIGDQRQILVLAAVGDLVHADVVQLVEPGVVELVSHDPRHDRAGGPPVDAAQPGDRGPVGVRDQPRDEVLEVPSVPRPVPRERHRLDRDPLTRAARQATQPAAHADLPDTEVQRPPRRRLRLPVVPGGGRPPAVRARQAAATQPHIDVHNLVVVDELDARHPHTDEVEQTIEYSTGAHDL